MTVYCGDLEVKVSGWWTQKREQFIQWKSFTITLVAYVTMIYIRSEYIYDTQEYIDNTYIDIEYMHNSTMSRYILQLLCVELS